MTCVGSILVGDMNCHHAKWLKYSNGITPEGRRLLHFATTAGMTQCVKSPTRGLYLLDLVLTDMAGCVKCKVLPPIADHRLVYTTVNVLLAIPEEHERYCWDFNKGDWGDLNLALEAVDWRAKFQLMDVDTCVAFFTQTLLNMAKKYIHYGGGRLW